MMFSLDLQILMSVRLGWPSARRNHTAEMKLEVTTAAVSQVVSSTGWLNSLNQIMKRVMVRISKYSPP